jgi:DNA-binding MarR family transcriptional regulator
MVDDVVLLLRLAHRRAAAAFADALRPFDVEDRHFQVLRVLHRRGPLSQRQLIDALGSDKSAMVRTVDDLERRGLAWRAPALADRRAYAVELTPAGRDLLADTSRVADAVTGALLAGLGADERELLRALLRRLVAASPSAAAGDASLDDPPLDDPPLDDPPPDSSAGPPPDSSAGPPPEPAYAPPHRTRRARAAAARPAPSRPRLTDLDEPDAPDSRRRLTH